MMYKLLLAIAFFAASVSADTAIPTNVQSEYFPDTNKLELVVEWVWECVSKVVSVGVFGDLNHDNIVPAPNKAESPHWDDPEEALAQYFGASITAKTGYFSGYGQSGTGSKVLKDHSASYGTTGANNIAYSSMNLDDKDSRALVMMPYALQTVNSLAMTSPSNMGSKQRGSFYGCGGTFYVDFENVPRNPKTICVVLYDIHIAGGTMSKTGTGDHGGLAGTPVKTFTRRRRLGGGKKKEGSSGHNTDNSIEKGWGDSTVSCTDPINVPPKVKCINHDEDCPVNYQLKTDQDTECAGTECNFNVDPDLSLCCEPLPNQECSDHVGECDLGQIRRTAPLASCAGLVCDFSVWPDRLNCCEDLKLCKDEASTTQCPTGYTRVDPVAHPYRRCSQPAMCDFSVDPDLGQCCEPIQSGWCSDSSQDCPVNWVKKADQSGLCVALTCNFATHNMPDTSTCCELVMDCKDHNEECPTGYSRVDPVAHPDRRCEGTVCDFTSQPDLGRCCEPNQDCSSASSQECPVNWVKKSDQSGLCEDTTCDFATYTSPDTSTCCELVMDCKDHNEECPTGYSRVDPVAHPDRRCEGTVCDFTSQPDLGLCCEPNQDCSSASSQECPVNWVKKSDQSGVCEGTTCDFATSSYDKFTCCELVMFCKDHDEECPTGYERVDPVAHPWRRCEEAVCDFNTSPDRERCCKTTPTPAPAPVPVPTPVPGPFPCDTYSCTTFVPMTFYQRGDAMTRCNCGGCYDNVLGDRSRWTPIFRHVATDTPQIITTSDGTFTFTNVSVVFKSDSLSGAREWPWTCCGSECETPSECIVSASHPEQEQ